MILDNTTIEYIKNTYIKSIKSKTEYIEHKLGFNFLQEIKIICSYNGEIKDIVTIFGDIENFSYKSIKNMIFELGIYSKLFEFEGFSQIVGLLKNLNTDVNSPGMDQYVGVSLLSGKIVEYYAIIGGIKHEFDKVSITFNTDFIEKFKTDFRVIEKIPQGTPGNIHIEFDDFGKISKKNIHYYDTSGVLFLEEIQKIEQKITNMVIKEYIDPFKKLENNNYWKDFICWNGYNNDTPEIKHYTLEFFLGKQTKYFSNFFGQESGITPYICQIGEDTITTWLLMEESFLKRKNKGYYKKYGIT